MGGLKWIAESTHSYQNGDKNQMKCLTVRIFQPHKQGKGELSKLSLASLRNVSRTQCLDTNNFSLIRACHSYGMTGSSLYVILFRFKMIINSWERNGWTYLKIGHPSSFLTRITTKILPLLCFLPTFECTVYQDWVIAVLYLPFITIKYVNLHMYLL